MKKFILLLLLIIFCASLPCSATKILQQEIAEEVSDPENQTELSQDEDYIIKGKIEFDDKASIFLDKDDIYPEQLNVNVQKLFLSKSVLSESLALEELKNKPRYTGKAVNEYLIEPVAGEVEYKIGNISYGTAYSTDMDIAQVEHRTKLFVKYDRKFFAFSTAYGKDAYTSSGRQLDSLYFVPEIKLGHGFVIREAIKSNPDISRHRAEFVVQYSPKINNSRENFKIEASAGQTYYSDGDVNFQFGVSTNFKLK